MLNRLLVVLDLVLVVSAASLGVHLHRIWAEAPPAAAASAPTPAGTAETAPAPPAAVKPPSPSASTFTVIAERNLFSPTRTETAPEPAKPPQTAGAPPARPPEKPRLYGVVLGSDGGPRAYLWDPQTKKVFGYKVGDSLADSRIEQINADRVVMRRGSEVFDVLLRDPSKPRPAPTPALPTAPVPGRVPGAPAPQVPQPLFPGAGTGAEGSSPFTPPGAGMTPGQPAVPGQLPFGSPGAATPSVPPQRRPPFRMPPGVPGGQTAPAQPQSSGDAGS